MPAVKKGDGCANLHLVRTPAVKGSGFNKANHRCCSKRSGFMLNHWRCVGADHPDCPGFAALSTTHTAQKE